MGEIKRISQVSRLYRLISFCAEISKGKWLHLYNLAEKKIAWFIQQRDTSCKSYTICLAQSRNREMQRRNYPRGGGVEGVEGRRGRGGWRVRRTYRGLAPCWTCFLHFHLLPPSFYKPPSSNLSSFDTTKHAMRDTR